MCVLIGITLRIKYTQNYLKLGIVWGIYCFTLISILLDNPNLINLIQPFIFCSSIFSSLLLVCQIFLKYYLSRQQFIRITLMGKKRSKNFHFHH